MRLLPALLILVITAAAFGATDTMPAGSVANSEGVARESIEWLDVWLPNSNDHDFPRVLLIGDSITRAYNKPVEKLLKGKAYVSRMATSKCLGDPMYLAEVELILQEAPPPDVIHFNNGMHGDAYTDEQYAADLPKLVALFRKYAPKAKLIAATTTDVRERNNLDNISPKTEKMMARNKIVTDFAAKENIPVDDLFALVKDHGEWHAPDGVHFAQPGIDAEAKQVAEAIGALLDAK
jgi:hypothetical protein